MFDIGWTELLMLAVLTLLVMGPKELPVLLRNLGRFTARMRDFAGQFKSALMDMEQQADLKEISSTVKNLSPRHMADELNRKIEDTIRPPDLFDDSDDSDADASEADTKKPGATGDDKETGAS
jgi:sec-independent protein translocase protein TatB